VARFSSVRRLRPRTRTGYLFILSYGRSGSTLLQGILNSIPGYLIRGENREALYHLYEFHRACAREAARLRRRHDGRPVPVTDAFYGMDGFSEQQSLAAIRELFTRTVLRPDRSTRTTGFKEIRWYRDDLPDFITFVGQVFPGARFVINTRDHEQVLRSRWWANLPRDGRLERMEDAILKVADDLGPRAYRVHYDDYVDDPSRLSGLFAWLGESFDEGAVRRVMATRHSY
jgi:sulfotransferase family protein